MRLVTFSDHDNKHGAIALAYQASDLLGGRPLIFDLDESIEEKQRLAMKEDIQVIDRPQLVELRKEQVRPVMRQNAGFTSRIATDALMRDQRQGVLYLHPALALDKDPRDIIGNVPVAFLMNDDGTFNMGGMYLTVRGLTLTMLWQTDTRRPKDEAAALLRRFKDLDMVVAKEEMAKGKTLDHRWSGLLVRLIPAANEWLSRQEPADGRIDAVADTDGST